MRKPLPEIIKMPCGHEAKVHDVQGEFFYVMCICHRMPQCWYGPECETARGAINAWNKIAGRLIFGGIPFSTGKEYRVKCCMGKTSRQCWVGPERKTKRGAINAWNKVAGRLRDAK